jgi:hypothetical protein
MMGLAPRPAGLPANRRGTPDAGRSSPALEDGMATKFGMHKDQNGRFFFNLTGEDGTELLRSLPHFTKGHALRAAHDTAERLQHDTHITKLESHGKLSFVLRNDRGEQIARSLHVRGPLALEELLQEARAAVKHASMEDTTDHNRLLSFF